MGEFGLIKLLANIVAETKNGQDVSASNLLIGIGDDTAGWKEDGSIQLATVDSLIQDVHFNLNTISWEELGYKAVAVNLSDIAAMGGVPKYCLVSLGLPGEIEVNDIKDLYYGMKGLANQFDVAIAGGNVSSAGKIMITVTVLGNVTGAVALLRSAAVKGDKIAITGYTGLSAAGMRMLKEDLHFTSEASALFRQAHLRPVPRIREGQVLLQHGVRAAIDISDGLVADLKHVCETSKVSALINKESIPIHTMLEAYFPEEHYQLALTGGEDYELLFTAPDYVLENVTRTLSCSIFVIGEIIGGTQGKVSVIDKQGRELSFGQSGWEHF